jgi:GT2 family glycosyltransferase
MIYILLPVHNRRDITRRFIACLEKQTVRNYHLVLIDDGSTDGTEEMVRSKITPLTVLKGAGDWWWTGALQQGYEWLRSRKPPPEHTVLIGNDDTEFGEHFLETALHILSQRSNMLLLAQSYGRESRRLIDAGVHADWRRLTFEQAASPEQINCLTARCLFLKVGDFFDIGGFYPRLLPHYAADYEFTMRAHRKGKTLMTDSALRVLVDEGATGFHHMAMDVPFPLFVKQLFSRKSIPNPVVWTFFILLACPWKWKFLNIGRIWKNIAAHLLVYGKRRVNQYL